MYHCSSGYSVYQGNVCSYCKVLVDLCVRGVSLLYLPFCPWQKCTVCTERKDIVT